MFARARTARVMRRGEALDHNWTARSRRERERESAKHENEEERKIRTKLMIAEVMAVGSCLNCFMKSLCSKQFFSLFCPLFSL